MNKSIQIVVFLISLLPALLACTSAKLEARLEANPQCKDVYNTKTGALMPCPGTDRSFYVAAGLEAPRQAKLSPSPATPIIPASSAPMAISPGTVTQAAQVPPIQSSPAAQPLPAQADCKPTIHKKTGGMLPCPPLD
jgi:hypothetical protein